ncbi:MAG: DUF5107 domain-containing protein [Planctomycetes bacterium]|nr:DUF5107 domain-containing protein [Planctomycetota bacterium]
MTNFNHPVHVRFDALRAGARIIFVCALALLASCGPGVTVRETNTTLQWYTSERNTKGDYYPMGVFMPARDSKKHAGARRFETVVLKNEYLTVHVMPETGGSVYRAIYRPTGEDIFFLEGKAKDWLPFWESGVKVSFPYREHGVGTIQPASYRIVRGDDGSITVAMWMEFARNTEWYHGAFYGRHSAMLLSQHVTLRPGDASFEITYRIVNPAPYRQGRQLWNDTFFPRDHVKSGVVQADDRPPEKTTSEFILPAAYVSHHGGADFRPFEEVDAPLVCCPPPHISIFTWDIRHGFAGMWYPEVKVNRLRLFDPKVSPGTKLFINGQGCYEPGSFGTHTYNFAEIWGGFDNVFEAVENWIGPGQAYEFTHRFAYVKGIGKVDFANGDAAVNVEFGRAPVLEVVTLRAVENLGATFNGKPLGQAKCAPDRPARFALPADATEGQVVLAADGRVIINRSFPLEIPLETTGLASIDNALRHSAKRHELSDGGGEAWYRDAIHRYPAGSVGGGRVLYRDGQLARAVTCLEKATETDQGNGEGWHLLGAALLEVGAAGGANAAFRKATSAENPYAPAWYFRALSAISRDSMEEASEMLGRLIEADRRHWEARLLKVWTDAATEATREQALSDCKALDAEDPADPRVQLLLRRCAEVTGNEPLAAQAGAAFDQLMKEPGAAVRLREFEAAMRGHYKASGRLEHR